MVAERTDRQCPDRTGDNSVDRESPEPFDGPAMLRGAAAADVLLVVPPAGIAAGARAAAIALRPAR